MSEEAALVRKIFGDYLRLGSIGALAASLESEIAAPNLIPMPAAHAHSTGQLVKFHCVRSSCLSKTDARTPQIPIDRVREPEALPARDFVPWRFSDNCRRSAWMVS